MESNGNNNINKRLEEIEATLQRFGSALERLESAICGDKYNNGQGYMRETDDLKKRVTALEKNQSSLKWFLFGSGATGGAGLVKVLESFF